MEGFLQYSEKAKRNIRRHLARNIAHLQVNLDVLFLAEFAAKPSRRHTNAQKFQPGRMQFVG